MFGRVSKGMHNIVTVGATGALKQNKKNVEKYFLYVNNYKQTDIVKNAMLEKYKEFVKKGIKQTNYVDEKSFFTNDKASMSILIFYLREKAPHLLKHMLHCTVKKWNAFNRRIFRRAHLHVELFFLSQKKTYSIKQSINCKKKTYQIGNNKTLMSKNNQKKSVTKNKIVLPTLPLTTENLYLHNKRKNDSQKAKRASKKPKLYQEEFQKDVKVNDDYEEQLTIDHPESDNSDGIEKRSIDSQSAGSLKDFIVNSDDEISEVSERDGKVHCDSDEEEEYTEEESVHTSDLSDIYSDQDE